MKTVICEECGWDTHVDTPYHKYWMKRVGNIPRSDECPKCGKTALTKIELDKGEKK